MSVMEEFFTLVCFFDWLSFFALRTYVQDTNFYMNNLQNRLDVILKRKSYFLICIACGDTYFWTLMSTFTRSLSTYFLRTQRNYHSL